MNRRAPFRDFLAGLAVLASLAPEPAAQEPKPAFDLRAGMAQLPKDLFIAPAPVAAQFLDAFRRHDDAAMQAAIDAGPPEKLDLVRVADELFGMHVAGREAGTGDSGDFLAAAQALADRVADRKQNEGLPALVAAWRALGADELAREAELRALGKDAHAALLQGGIEATQPVAAKVRPRLDAAPRSCTAVSLQFQLGITAATLGRTGEARLALRAAATAAEQLRWHFARAEVLLALGQLDADADDPRAALETMEQERALREALGHERRLADLHLGIGDMHARVGSLAAALPHYEQGRLQFERLGDRSGLARALFVIGFTQQLLGRSEDAAPRLRQALELQEALGDTDRATRTRGSLGLVLFTLGEHEQGVALLRQAIGEAEARPDRAVLVELLGHLGDTQAASNRFADAHATYERARTESLARGERSFAASNLANVANCLGEMGRYAEAVHAFEQAGRELSACGRRLNAAQVLLNLTRLQLHTRDYAGAAAVAERTIAELDRLGDESLLGLACYQLGSAHYGLGQFDRALAPFDRALAVFEAQGSSRGIPLALAALGRTHTFLGHGDLALELLEQARTLERAMGDRQSAASTTRAIGGACMKRSDWSAAVTHLEAALAEFTALGAHREAADALEGLARARLEQGDPQAAIAAAREALALWSSIDRDLPEVDALALSSNDCIAAQLGVEAAALLAAREPGAADRALAEALWCLEAGRGLVLTAGLINHAALLAANVDPELCAGETAARERLARAQREVLALGASAGVDADEAAEAKARLDAAYLALQGAIARTQREAARVAAVVHPEPVALSALQQSLAPDEVLVEYLTGEDISFALVIARDGGRIVPLGDTGELVRHATAWLDLLGVPGSDEAAAAAWLHDRLLRPLEGALAGKKRILVAPEDVLTFVPMDALLRVDGERRERAIERFEIDYVPSASAFAALRAEAARTPRGRGLLALGDPVYPGETAEAEAPAPAPETELRGLGRLRRLPATGDEVRAIAALFGDAGTSVLLRERASLPQLEAALRSGPPRLAAVHFACHGHVDLDRPRLTGLVLAGGEVLTLDRLYQLRIPADLAVLSACETAKGRLYRGEGVVGLVRGFFFSGCPRVVVSDWRIGDEPTRSLMVEFYRRQLADGIAAGAALRAVKLARLRSAATAHPCHWAAFVLWGLPD